MKTREDWLNKALELIRTRIFEQLAEAPELPERVHVSCGWPSKGGTKPEGRTLGQCWHPCQSEDGAPQIFISPVLDQPLEVLGVLAHEMIHAGLPEAKHGKTFKEAARAIGLEGPPKATETGPRLLADLVIIAEALGEYPHPKLDPKATLADAKPQKNRQLKIACPTPEQHEEGEPYILRGSAKVLGMGVPKCPVCAEDLVREDPPTEEEEE